ncbi:hypothetical protein WJX81_006662 [Elliptochloris bilobata]|uniref:Uncharacterized protein n=1 Tax=Elliptochloris bilobata TaxID=381761 RepID=A0AAW1S5Q6_9CHLO
MNAAADEAAGAAHKRGYVARLRAALKQYSEAFLAGAELSASVMRDLQAFLDGDVEELPVSLRQLSRLAQSQEVQRSTSLMVAAADLSASPVPAAAGDGGQRSMRGCRRRARQSGGDEPAGGMLEQVLAALTSERGSSLVTLAIGVACRTSVQALSAAQQRSEEAAAAAGRPDLPERLMRFAGTPDGRRFANSCVATFVREGTCAYLDRFEGMNMWDDLLGAMAKPAHTAAVDRMTRTFAREMVSSYFSPPRASPARGHMQREITAAQPPAAPHGSSPAAVGSKAAAAEAKALENGHGELAAQRAEFAEWADDSGSDAGRVGSGLGWASDVIQIAKAPEARAMLAALAASATAEGALGGVFSFPGPLGTVSQLLHPHAGPIAPGQGFLPLGNLLTSDFGGPYNLSLLSTQENEVKAAIAFKANYTDKDLVRFLTNVECLEAQFDFFGAFGRNIISTLTLNGSAPLGAKAANLTEATRPFLEEIALTEQGHLLFTRQAGSTDPCPLVDFEGGFNAFFAAAYALPAGQSVAQKFGAAFDPFLNDANFVLSMLVLEELGATGNKGAAGLVTNPVLANSIVGLATSASTFAGIERFLLWQMGNTVVEPFNETVRKVFARASALRDSLDGPQLDDQGLVNTDPRYIIVPDGMVNLVPTDIRGLTFSRTPAMLINILTLGSPSGKGGFFPNGLNGVITSPAGYDAVDPGTKSFAKAVASGQETVAQLGAVQPPITGATPATVFGDDVVFQALAASVLDSGNASTRGLNVLPVEVHNDLFVDPATANNTVVPKQLNHTEIYGPHWSMFPNNVTDGTGIVEARWRMAAQADRTSMDSIFDIVKWVAAEKYRNEPIMDNDVAMLEVTPIEGTDTDKYGNEWGALN